MPEVDPSTIPADMAILVVSSLALIGFPPPFEGCERRPCIMCGRDVWATPSTLHAEELREVVHSCQRCAISARDELAHLPQLGRLCGAAEDIRIAVEKRRNPLT